MKSTKLKIASIILSSTLLSFTATTSLYAMNYPKGNFNSWNKTELYFGSELASGKLKNGPCLSSPSNTAVTLNEFKCFLDNVVTPRFPYGLTWTQANGQWTDPSNPLNSPVLKENSYYVVIYYPSSSGSNASIEEIRSLYLDQMGQSSVLRVDNTNDKISF